MSTIRAFIAVPLSQAILDRISRIQRRLQDRVPPRSVRWVRTSGIHLTLKFLGDVSTDKIPVLESALQTIADIAPGCTFTVNGLGCFPNSNRPRVIWVGIEEPSGRLAALQDAVEETTVPFGFEREDRGFKPHLTVGRLSRRASRADVASVGALVARTEVGTLGEAVADRFILIQSVLKPSGAEYTPLREFRLQMPGADNERS